MPCGGIGPTSGDYAGSTILFDGQTGCCWMCRKAGAKHFVEEWDTFVHARCAVGFLGTEEGRLMTLSPGHLHAVVLDFSLEVEPDLVPMV